MGVFNYNNDMVKENIRRIISILDLLPIYLRLHDLEEVVNKDDPDDIGYKIKPKSMLRKCLQKCIFVETLLKVKLQE